MSLEDELQAGPSDQDQSLFRQNVNTADDDTETESAVEPPIVLAGIGELRIDPKVQKMMVEALGASEELKRLTRLRALKKQEFQRSRAALPEHFSLSDPEEIKLEGELSDLDRQVSQLKTEICDPIVVAEWYRRNVPKGALSRVRNPDEEANPRSISPAG